MCLLHEASGARACRTLDELTCAATERCVGGLSCVRGRCVQPCTETADCGGTVCASLEEERVCVEPGETCAVAEDCGLGICLDGRCDEVRSLNAGERATCLLLESGRLLCAGSNLNSLLSGDDTVRFVPAFERVLDTAGTQPAFESIELGASHACALAAGRVRCWGGGEVGQNGAGANIPPIPSPLSVLSQVQQIAAARVTSCARTEDAVFCFGWDQFGQLGDAASHGTESAWSAAPVRVELPDGVVPIQLHTSGFHACVVDTVGAVYCWGGNDFAQISPGPSTLCPFLEMEYGCEPTPVRIDGFGPGETRAVQVVVGQSHTCILDDAGAVHCFGQNHYGQLGVGAIADRVPTPVVPIAGGVRALDAGLYFTCALLMDGRLSCWGRNNAGQLGTGAGPTSIAPTDVDGLHDVADFSCGEEHACAVQTNGNVYCWGAAGAGRLGNDPEGPDDRGPVPVPVRVFAGLAAR